MLIKFKAPDPRAGMVAQMDSRRGQDLIDSGAAAPATPGAAPGPAPVPAAPAKPAKKAK